MGSYLSRGLFTLSRIGRRDFTPWFLAAESVGPFHECWLVRLVSPTAVPTPDPTTEASR